MKKEILIIILGLFLLVSAIVMSLFFINSDRIKLITEQKIKINQLELKIEILNRSCRWAIILEQILPPKSQHELDLMEEQIRQWRSR